jgi:hypothetical protein
MPTGKDTFFGLVPIYGEFEFNQKNAINDMLTFTGAPSQTGDFLVAQDSARSQVFALTAEGRMEMKVFTTRPTTGLVKGELMVLFHGSTPKIGICSSTAAQTIKLVRLRTKTFGRLTA